MGICFIVGHGKSAKGGYDPGATSGGHQEFKIAREIAKYAQEYYNANYSEHADLMNYDADKYLTERIRAVNAADYDLIAEIHLNAAGGTGTECYYHNKSTTGEAYAAAISKAISDEFGVKNRGARVKLNNRGKDYFAIIRDTKPTALLIETMFVDSMDVGLIASDGGQRRCGEAIAKAIATARKAEPRKEEPEIKEESETTELHCLQFGAFANRENAEKECKRLKAMGIDVIITTKTVEK